VILDIVEEVASGRGAFADDLFPFRRDTSLIASAIIATGLTVGCRASSSSLPVFRVLTPRYSQTLVR
jgi:hypothetical protein